MLKKIVMTTLLSVCFASTVIATTPPPQEPPQQPSCPESNPEPPQGKPYYICSAHNTEDDFWLHYGEAKCSQCEAQESAVQVCEEFEKQECEVHDCRFFIH